MSFSPFKRLNYLLPVFVDVKVVFVLATALLCRSAYSRKNVVAVTYMFVVNLDEIMEY